MSKEFLSQSANSLSGLSARIDIANSLANFIVDSADRLHSPVIWAAGAIATGLFFKKSILETDTPLLKDEDTNRFDSDYIDENMHRWFGK